MITTYNACPRMYKYQYVEHLAPKVYDHKLYVGSAVHKALEAYYKGEDAIAAYNTWVSSALEGMPDIDPDEMVQFEKDTELGRVLVQHYIPWAKAHDTFNVLAAEQSFAVPIWDSCGEYVQDAVYAGTFDGVAEDIYGNIWLMEHKTYSRTPSVSELRMDGQAGYYLMAAQQLFPDRKVLGIIYTILRKVHPDRAKSEIVHRTQVMRNEHELSRLRERLYLMYKMIVSDKLYIPTPGFHCGWMCRYRQLCIAEEDGSDVQELRDALYDVVEERRIYELSSLEGTSD